MSVLTTLAGARAAGRGRRRYQRPSVLGRIRPARRATAERVALPWATVAAVSMVVTMSVLAAWTVLYALVFSGLQAERTNSVLYAELREGLSAATTPIGGAIKPGTPIALLRLPAAGLTGEVIVEGTAPGDLRAGPGHRRDTPLPGQAGVSVLYGRSVTFGAPFARLASLTTGTQFTVTTGQGTFTYAVDGVRHAGDPVPKPLAADGSRLMLETTTRAGLHFGPATTLFVDATLVKGAVAPTPPGRPSAISEPERAMSADTSVLLPLVLWLQALVLVSAAIVWAWLRWGAWQTWLLGVPLVVAVLWGAGSAALMLMPNLI